MNHHSWKKYVLVFVITCGIFGTSWYLSGYFNERKLVGIRETQNQVATDIIASETQFDLLEELSCDDIGNTYLSDEIGKLAEKIAYGEQNLNAPEEILLLKQQYTILEAKEYLLTKRIAERCNKQITTILYFYATKDACADCVKQGYVLDAVREKYKAVRVYSFDYDLDSSTIRALKTIYKMEDGELPALVINGEVYTGFLSLPDIEATLPLELTNPSKPSKRNG
jgi:hypothetical protein